MSEIDTYHQSNYGHLRKPSSLQEKDGFIIPLKLMPNSQNKETVAVKNSSKTPLENDVQRIYAHFVTETKNNHRQKIQHTPHTTTDKELGAKTLIALTTIAGVIGAGSMLGGFLIGKKSHKTHSNNPSNSSAEIHNGHAGNGGITGNDVFNIMPDILKSSAIGLAGIIGAIGFSSWLNKETPERLKMRIQNLKLNP